MPSVINYEKYENMNLRQLVNSLSSAEKKFENLQEQSKLQAGLISFIRTKIKARADEPKLKGDFIPFRESELYKEAKAYEATISESENETINNEMLELANKDYGDEL